MGTPREPIHLVAAGDRGVPSMHHRVRLVGVQSGRDWTGDMDRWRGPRIVDLAHATVAGFVVKSKSPSCGLEGVQVDHGGTVSRDGRGLFTEALLTAIPGLPVEDEERLRDPNLRAAFLERVFAYERATRTEA
jgi:uncharacterized protein YbbK (DUF523 family)